MELNNRDVVFRQNTDEFQKKNKIIKNLNQTAVSNVNPDLCFETYDVDKKTFDNAVNDLYKTEEKEQVEEQIPNNNIVLDLRYDYIEIYLLTQDGGEIIWGDGETTIFGPNTDSNFEHIYGDFGDYNIIINCPSIIQFTVRDLDMNSNNNQLNCYFNANPILERIEMDDTFLTYIAFNHLLPSLTYLRLDNNELYNIDLTNVPILNHLNINDNNLTTIDVSLQTALTYLNLSGNNLTNINLFGLDVLESLYLQNNSLTLVMLPSLALRYLDISYNQLTMLSVNSPVLYEVNCSNNPITTLIINTFSIVELYCNYTSLFTLDLNTRQNLVRLEAYNNPNLFTVNLNSCINLQVLNLNNCDISSGLTITNCPSLGIVYLDNNMIPLEYNGDKADEIVQQLASENVFGGFLSILNQNATWLISLNTSPLTSKGWTVLKNNDPVQE